MAKPSKQLFGNIYLDGLKKAITEVPTTVQEYQGKKNFKVKAAMWDDGSITFSVWNADKKENINIGKLNVSKFDTTTEVVTAIDELFVEETVASTEESEA